MLNYPTNRTDALARLPAKERGASAKAFNYVIFAKLDHYRNAKVCALREATSLPSTKLDGVRGTANVVASAADPVRIKLIPAEATIARLSVEFSYAGYTRAKNGAYFLPLFANGTTAALQAQQEEAAMEAKANFLKQLNNLLTKKMQGGFCVAFKGFPQKRHHFY